MYIAINLLLVSTFSLLLVGNCVESQKCVFRSVCDDFSGSIITGLKIPCVAETGPQTITDQSLLRSLQEVCPHLDPINNPTLCCDEDQINQLVDQLALPKGMLSRCPSCFYNFANYLCEMTCSPKQSTFLRLDASEPSKSKPGKQQITAISYAIEEKFAQTLFNSCVNVLAPGPGDKPIKIMCGNWGDQCNAHRLLEYVGQKDPSPFNIKFQYYPDSNDTGISPIPLVSSQCFEAPGVANKSACSCSDCPAVCKPLPQPESHEIFKIFGIDGMALVMSIIFVATTTLVVLYFTHYERRKQTHEDENALCDSTLAILPRKTIGSRLEAFLEHSFTQWGYMVTGRPILVIIIGIALVLVTGLELRNISSRITSDPVELWSSPKSQARQEKQYFDEMFGPFYRTNQLIIKRTTNEPSFLYNSSGKEYTFNSIFEKDFLLKILELEQEITSLTAKLDGETIKLNDICFSPLGNGLCAVQSVFGWFQENATHFDDDPNSNYTYLDHLVSCLSNPYALDDNLKPFHYRCLGEYGGPALPKVALAGFNLADSQKDAAAAYTQATSLVITILVNNHADKSQNKKAEAWEKVFLDYLNAFNHTRFPNLDITYFSERSVQDEINRQSLGDISTITVSYLVMFAYVSLTLGRIPSKSQFFVHSKIGLGFLGVITVIASVISSIGLMILLGFNLTLIIMEVIPFLVLAVGVDNIFILAQHLQRYNPKQNESSQDQVAKVLGKCGPSILMAFACEVTCFFIGALSTMPAIRMFALNAALALLIDFLLQMSVFIAVLYLDLERQKSSRFDILCCFQSSKNINPDPTPDDVEAGLLQKICKDHYAPFLMKDKVRLVIFISFTLWVCSSIAVVNKIEVGLDQELSMPHDSYVLKYFKAQKNDLRVGPPVYFVVGGKFDYSEIFHQEIICGASFCGENSLFNQISQASHEPESSYIVDTPASWLDDYFDWAGSSSCCRIFKNDTNIFCPSTLTDINRSKDCKQCPILDDDQTVKPKEFYAFLPDYLSDEPTANCPKGGLGAYGAAVKLGDDGRVLASHYSSYHSPLVKSSDFIEAMKSARFLASNIERAVSTALKPGEEVKVFPYSLVYVYYEQYLTIYGDSIRSLALSITAIFLVSFVLYGFDIKASLIVVFTIICIVINLMGMMYWWDISLNALSLVNLVMAAGISVEFCSHITHAYLMSNEASRVKRSQEALATMGSSVLSGITLTKFAGILVLAWSTSQIFVVFYFRMYFGIVIIGALHGLVLLPVLLSVFGGKPKLSSSFIIDNPEQAVVE
ncbi:NPC intracellular cholesterol transporter 1-like isoform X2 [Tetranychus urticae]|uniref:NPC intracellular cholesterol transporter 1-like isoform X2 n=1 Tax=Tetranychus urticae TaxID=32264 RepID=UPI00077BCC66|nr:NPC intracellular cholesterol transporter 1-like isoform X2 [Tetranychus urticae]